MAPALTAPDDVWVTVAFQAEVTRIQTDANLINARAQLRLASGWSLLR